MNATTVFDFPSTNPINLMMDSMFDNTQHCQDPLFETCVASLPDFSPGKHSLFDKGVEGRISKKLRIDSVGETRRIPCKARGMPEDHNSELAYFEIPADATHGKILACSHPDCEASGRRFRYCAVCALPVAKRNFMKRHAHGIFSTSKELMDADSNEEDSPICSFVGETEKYISSSSEQGTILATRQSKGHRRVVSSDTRAAKESQNGTASPATSPNLAIQLNANEFKWVSLLHDRPETEDTASMSQWMETVIKLSEDVAPPDSASTPYSSVARVSPLVSSCIPIVSPIIEKFNLTEQTGLPAPPLVHSALSQRGHLDADSDLSFDDIDFAHIFDF